MLYRQFNQIQSSRPIRSGVTQSHGKILISELILSQTLYKVDSIRDTSEEFSAFFGWCGQIRKIIKKFFEPFAFSSVYVNVLSKMISLFV